MTQIVKVQVPLSVDAALLPEIIPEFGKYYVVEVAFKKNNPIHRAIMGGWRSDGMTLFAIGYGHLINIRLDKLAWFRIVEEIASMCGDYPNRFKLPHEAAAITAAGISS